MNYEKKYIKYKNKYKSLGGNPSCENYYSTMDPYFSQLFINKKDIDEAIQYQIKMCRPIYREEAVDFANKSFEPYTINLKMNDGNIIEFPVTEYKETITSLINKLSNKLGVDRKTIKIFQNNTVLHEKHDDGGNRNIRASDRYKETNRNGNLWSIKEDGIVDGPIEKNLNVIIEVDCPSCRGSGRQQLSRNDSLTCTDCLGTGIKQNLFITIIKPEGDSINLILPVGYADGYAILKNNIRNLRHKIEYKLDISSDSFSITDNNGNKYQDNDHIINNHKYYISIN